MYNHVVTLTLTDVSEVHTASIIALMIQIVRTSQTSVYFNETTQRFIPQGYHFQTRHRKNLKTHWSNVFREVEFKSILKGCDDVHCT
jgi:hypothetical protein